jgi:hypothetical protein
MSPQRLERASGRAAAMRFLTGKDELPLVIG